MMFNVYVTPLQLLFTNLEHMYHKSTGFSDVRFDWGVCKKFKWRHIQMCKLKSFKTTPRTTVSTLRAEIKLSMSPEFCILHMQQPALQSLTQAPHLGFYQCRQESLAPDSRTTIVVRRIADSSSRRTPIGEAFLRCLFET